MMLQVDYQLKNNIFNLKLIVFSFIYVIRFLIDDKI